MANNEHLNNIAIIRKNLNAVAKACSVETFSVHCGRGTARGWCEIDPRHDGSFSLQQTVLLNSLGIGCCANTSGLDFSDTRRWAAYDWDVKAIKAEFEALLADHLSRPSYRPAWPQPEATQEPERTEQPEETVEDEPATVEINGRTYTARKFDRVWTLTGSRGAQYGLMPSYDDPNIFVPISTRADCRTPFDGIRFVEVNGRPVALEPHKQAAVVRLGEGLKAACKADEVQTPAPMPPTWVEDASETLQGLEVVAALLRASETKLQELAESCEARGKWPMAGSLRHYLDQLRMLLGTNSEHPAEDPCSIQETIDILKAWISS